MSNTIYGIPVGTPISPEKVGEILKPVKSVNGQTPDENGNVEVKVSSDLGGKIVLDSSNFVQGLFTFGVGIEANDYWITTNPAIPVNAGDKIAINPNGCRVTVRTMDSANILESTIARVLGTVEGESAELTAEADGWLCFLVKNATKLTPETYPCEISVGESEFDKLRAEVEEMCKNATGSTVIPSLTGDLKNKPPVEIVDDCQSTADWRITNTSTDVPTVDTEGHIMFDQCLHSDSQMRCTAKSYDLLKNNIVLKIKVNSIAEGEKLYLRLRNKDKASEHASYEIMRGTVNAATGVWLDIAVPYNGYYAINGSPDFGNINDVQLYTSGGAVDWNLQYIGTMPKVLSTGIVSFTFDDGYKSQYTGIKILAEKGITGTVYPSSLTIPEGNADYMTVQELQELVSLYGTHIGMHHSTVYDQMTPEELANHWTEYQRVMKETGLGDGRHMAYPGGRHPAEVVQMARGYFDSCRTINGFAHAETFPPVDNYRMKAISSIGNAGNDVSYIMDKIDRAVASGSWLILVFHRIEDGDTTMYCSESDLRAIADYAIASGAIIKNVSEVFNSGLGYGGTGDGNADGGNVDLSGYAKKEFVEEKIAEELEGLEIPESGNGINVSGAEVGQFLKIAEVDENGVPTAWETADLPGGSPEWVTLGDVTLTEDVARVEIDTSIIEGHIGFLRMRYDLIGATNQETAGIITVALLTPGVKFGVTLIDGRSNTVPSTNDSALWGYANLLIQSIPGDSTTSVHGSQGSKATTGGTIGEVAAVEKSDLFRAIRFTASTMFGTGSKFRVEYAKIC